MNEFELFAYFDTEDATFEVSRLLSQWFNWLLAGCELSDAPPLFDDMGVSPEDFQVESDEIEWEEEPLYECNGNCIHITLTDDTIFMRDMIEDLLEMVGAQEINEQSDEY